MSTASSSLAETSRFAHFIHNLQLGDIPPDVRNRARMVMLDTIGCAYGGYATDVGDIVTGFFPHDGAASMATLLGSGRRTRVPDAIYANARLANVLDADETLFTIEHLANTAVTVPLAICEAEGYSGDRLLESVIAGYEVGARIGARPILNTPEDGPPTWATARDGGSVRGFGLGMTYAAVASAAKALDLSPEQIHHALGIAGERVPDRTHSRLYDRVNPLIKYQQAGACARAGYEAAIASSLGDTGIPDLLDGDEGIWAMFGVATIDHESLRRRLLSNLGEQWETGESVLKPWPCCHFNQFVLDDLRRLIDREDLAVDEITRVRQHSPTFLTSPRFQECQPEHMIAAQFSVPHAIAMVLTETPIDQWYAPGLLNSSDISCLREIVEVVPKESLSVRQENGIIREIEFEVEIETQAAMYDFTSRMTRGMPWYSDSRMTADHVAEKFLTFTTSFRPQSGQWRERMEATAHQLLAVDTYYVRDVMDNFIVS